MSVRENRHAYFCIIEGWRGVPVCMCRFWFDSRNLNRTEGEMPEIIAGVLKRIRDDIDKFVDNKTKDYENI